MAEVGTAPATAKSGAIARRLLELNESLLERNRQLERALESRIAIEQAKGVLAARHGVPVDVAFDALRRGARSTGTKLHDLAARVVQSPRTPREIERHLS